MTAPTYPLQVRVSYVRSLGASTEADLTSKVIPPQDGMLREEPRVGAPMVLWRGARRLMITSPVQRVEAGAGRTWEVMTLRSIYRVHAV